MAKNAAGSGSTKPTKEEKKAAKAEKRAAGKERRTQLWQAFQMQRKQDKKLLPYMIGAVVGTAAVLTLALMWFLPWWAVLPLGMIGVSLVTYLTMRDTKTHSRILED